MKKLRLVRPELDRLMFEVLHALRDLKNGVVARRAGLSPQTIKKMRTKVTRYPHAVTLIAIARVGGLRLTTEVMPINVGKQTGRRAASTSEARV